MGKSGRGQGLGRRVVEKGVGEGGQDAGTGSGPTEGNGFRVREESLAVVVGRGGGCCLEEAG